MRRYRNARFAPESLERKLSPSSVGVMPAPAAYSGMSSPAAYSSNDYLVYDDGTGDVPPPPGEGEGPILTPDDPTGPVVPA